MASPSHRQGPPEVINLLSDDEEDDDYLNGTASDSGDHRPARRRRLDMRFDRFNPFFTPLPPRIPDQANPLLDNPPPQRVPNPIASVLDTPPPQNGFDTTPTLGGLRTPSPPPSLPNEPQHTPSQRGTLVFVDGEEVFIPDEDVNRPPSPRTTSSGAHRDEPALTSGNVVVSSAEDCLLHILEIFPDISHDHVYTLYHSFDRDDGYEILAPAVRLDHIVDQLASASTYPKQDKGKKRKRDVPVPAHDDHRWETKERASVPGNLKGPMQAMLKAEFPEIPVLFINSTLHNEQHLYHAYLLLARTKDSDDQTTRPYGKGRPSVKTLANAVTIATNCGWPPLVEELQAARRAVEAVKAERAAEDEKKRAEQENLQRAIAAGETTECSACYDDLPMNRQIHCNGRVAHFTCFDCVEMYIKSEVGESRCRVICPAGCGSGFTQQQLDQLSNKQLLEKFAQIQQEKDIRDAGLEDLEECPFCDYKVILPPVEQDFEFRCANPECERVSCRRCKAVSHVPISCEQHAQDNKLNSRHTIEEAMTAALVRSCNKCKKQFVKEFGCNKMTCPSCGNKQCYVCSASVKDYEHFDQTSRDPWGAPAPGAKGKKCPLHDNVEERHEREVKEAEERARAQIVAENPDVTAEDLEIKLSDAVKQGTANRLRQGRAGDAGLGNALDALRDLMGGYGGYDGADDFDLDLLRGRRRQVRRRPRRNPQPAPAPGANRPWELQAALEPMQGYIPVLGYHDALPFGHPYIPPAGPRAWNAVAPVAPANHFPAHAPQPARVDHPPAYQHQRDQAENPLRRGLAGNVEHDLFGREPPNDYPYLDFRLPIRQPHNDGNVFNDDNYHDHAWDLLPRLNGALDNADPYPFDPYANPPALQHELARLQLPPLEQQEAQPVQQPARLETPLYQRPPPPLQDPQPFAANIRNHRIGFEHLEMLRQQHADNQFQRARQEMYPPGLGGAGARPGFGGQLPAAPGAHHPVAAGDTQAALAWDDTQPALAWGEYGRQLDFGGF